ncbi:MAG: hypothetical protein ACI4F0_03380, partial [Agathobacter sp.]
MNKKKVDNILKGIASAGVIAGGTSIIQNTDVVFAQENQEVEEDSESTLEEMSASASASTVLSEDIMESESESASGSTEGSESIVESESESASEVVSLEDSEIASLSESASEILSTEDSELASQSDSASNSAISESESYATALSEYGSMSEQASIADSAYESALSEFQENGYEDEYLEDLIAQINAKEAELQEKIEEGKSLNDNGFYTVGDELAELLIRYAFYQEGYVTNISYSAWDNKNSASGYAINNVKVEYVDTAGVIHVAYFDYVTVDKDGVALVNPDNGGAISDSNNPDKVGGIMVVIKETEYRNGNDVLTWAITQDADGNDVTTYYVNGEALDSNTIVTLNDDGTYTIQEATTSTATDSKYYDENGNLVEGNTYYDWYNGDVITVNDNLAVKTEDEVKVFVDQETGSTVIYSDEDSSNNNATKLYTIDGKNYWYYNSTLDANDDGTYTLTAYERTETIKAEEYIEYSLNKAERGDRNRIWLSKGYYVFDGDRWVATDKNTEGVVRIKESGWYKTTETVHEAVYDYGWASSGTEFTLLADGATYTKTFVTYGGEKTYTPQFVASKEHPTYTDNNGNEHDGNFNKKGNYYFSQKDYKEGADDYGKNRSELTSASNAKSESDSLRDSLSNSISSASESGSILDSLSASVSESNSTIRSESLSTSASLSDSNSTSLSDARSESSRLSESASTSASVSASTSASTSASLSESASTSGSTSASTSASVSASTSESASTSLSESTSTSLSESTSTSLSESASTSLSESTSTSLSESTSTSLSESTSTSLSESTSTSLSESTSTSLSESTSTSLSESASTSLSESTSTSLSESTSTSLSESTSTSLSESTSTSLSESTSTSLSESTSTSLSESTST